MDIRAGEAERPWFRSERYYHTGDGWWFTTREEDELGPFATQDDAKTELTQYIQSIQVDKGSQPSTR